MTPQRVTLAERRSEFGAKNLDRNGPVVLAIPGQKHDRHASRPELAFNVGGITKGVAEAGLEVVHDPQCFVAGRAASSLLEAGGGRRIA